MKQLFTYLLLITLTWTGATSSAACVNEFARSTGGPSPDPTDADVLDEIVRGLRARKFTELTNAYHAERIKLVHLPESITVSPLVRTRWSGVWRRRPALEFTALRYQSEAQRQRLEWDVIKNLFEIELHARLRDRPPRSRTPRLSARPPVVAAYQAERLTALLTDFYEAMGALPLVHPLLMLPPEDPGRPRVPIAAVLFGPPQRIAPNRHDWREYFEPGGKAVLGAAIGTRYERALMYAYWRAYVVSSVGALGTIGLAGAFIAVSVPSAATTPQIPEVSASEFGPREIVRDSELSDAQRAIIRAEYHRLNDQLERVRNQSASDPPIAQIEKIKQAILDLKYQYPFLVLPGEALH